MARAIIVGVMGIVCEWIGYLLWKKEKISLLHNDENNLVSPENKTVFCKLSGIGITVIGTGMIVTAVMLAVSEPLWSVLAFAIGFVVGLGLLMYAENKYNRCA